MPALADRLLEILERRRELLAALALERLDEPLAGLALVTLDVGQPLDPALDALFARCSPLGRRLVGGSRCMRSASAQPSSRRRGASTKRAPATQGKVARQQRCQRGARALDALGLLAHQRGVVALERLLGASPTRPAREHAASPERRR